MTKYILILFICLLQNSFAGIPYYVANHNNDFPTYLNVWKAANEQTYTGTTHYVSTTGSNANAGTIGSPWLTLAYAATQVTTPGDTIYINSGTYIETQPAMIAVGVSIKGADSATTIIKSHYVADWNFSNPSDAAIAFTSSTEGTNGNQSLSGITLDGDNLTGTLGILVKLRSNVIIHNIKVKDFYINGIGYYGSAVNSETQPTTYSVGNRLYNFTITNCSDSDATWVGGGNINICGQQDLQIHDFILADTSRSAGRNGDNIINNRFGRGVKIYNGTSYKPSTPDAAWNFHFEIPWGNGGTEIYNVNFIGGDCAVDIGGDGVYDEATYSYLFSIHDSYFEDTNPTHNGSRGKTALTIEGKQVKNVLMYNNKFKNIVQPVGITDGTSPGVASHDTNIVFRNSTVMNAGVNNPPYYQTFIDINKNEVGGSVYGVYIMNITMIPDSTVTASAFSITNYKGSRMKNIVIANNILRGYSNGTWLQVVNSDSSSIDSLIIRNNITYNDANSDNPTFSGTGSAVTHYINSGNITSDPLLTSSTDYTPQSGSPAIGAAYPYGYGVDIGAVQYTVTAPTISMSANQTISTNSTSISAVGTPYSGHTITGYQWTQTQGTGTIGNATSASTTVSNLSSGINKFQCIVTQDDAQTASGTVTITVSVPVAPTSYIKYKVPHKYINTNQ